MKLRNKKTGEIMDDVQYRNYSLSDGFGFRMNGKEWEYHSLAELNEDWEDVPEEPKECWAIDCFVPDGDLVSQFSNCSESVIENRKSIGNYFETKEEAEKAVEKLKAWKRLKDKGFEFCCDIKYENLCGNGFNISLNAIMPPEAYADIEVSKDLDLLFGGEE